MIVVLLIGILLAIAVPQFRQSRGNARLTKVKADLKTINDARLHYCTETGNSQCYDIPHEYLVPVYLKAVPEAPGCMGYEYDWGVENGNQGETRFGGWSLAYLNTPAGKAECMAQCS